MLRNVSIRTLRKVHLYLSCSCTPVLVLFIVTGLLQTFTLHRGRKDNSYHPPALVHQLSHIHTKQGLSGPDYDKSVRALPFQLLVVAAVVGLLGTIAIGVIMAFKTSPSKSPVWLCFVAGTIIPAVILLLEQQFR